ncbi:MAG: PAS domain-containing protein [Comamonadaceae bacterium]|nr:PAS domain-containing protein [Comamonadaceae bacterium]
MKNAQALQSVLDALPASVAVVDAQGRIERVNRAWREFAQANGAQGGVDVGASYLGALRVGGRGRRGGPRLPGRAAGGDGRAPAQLRAAVPCDAPDRPRWFLMHATSMPRPQGGMVVSHLEVSGWMDERGTGLAGGAVPGAH